MAIVEMKRLTLLAMTADKDNIYDALIRTGAVQLKRSAEIPGCNRDNPSFVMEKTLEKVNRAEEVIHYVCEQAELFNAENKSAIAHKTVAKAEVPKGSFARPLTEINFDYFLSFGENAEQIESEIATVVQMRNKIAELEALSAQKTTEMQRLEVYRELPHPTTWYQNTESTIVQLCSLPASSWEGVKNLANEFDMVSLEKVCEAQSLCLVVAIVHKSQTEFFEKAVVFGLAKSTVVCEILPALILKDLQAELEKTKAEISHLKMQIAEFSSKTVQWKIYVDYLELCKKKAEADFDLQTTSSTFVLEAFYPAEAEEKVKSALQSVSDSLVVDFFEIGEEEFAPTLTRNNKIVTPFESVTNMYTPPEYHEIDPNPVMSVFYFLIFGFMVADIGYGLLLVLAGLFATFAIKQRTGMKTLLQMFGICGVSAMLVGALFGSFFSYSLGDILGIDYHGVIPDPSQQPMVMMALSLFLGIFHITAGVGCNMAVKIKHKQKLSAWFADFPWILVFLSLIVAIFNMALDLVAYEPYEVLRLPQQVSDIALYVCLGSLAWAVVFAGVGAKGFGGKMVKSFGKVYGIINYFTDIMSYIRVFGLMLSSALIGVVVNQLGAMVMNGGGIGYVFGALVLVFAHLFNLVMGCLSVYIHNGRLQYVEFFGKFYTGDGMLFVPFGSDTRYTLVTNEVTVEK